MIEHNWAYNIKKGNVNLGFDDIWFNILDIYLKSIKEF